jgi:hypothetical protein
MQKLNKITLIKFDVNQKEFHCHFKAFINVFLILLKTNSISDESTEFD